jgi:hypothetical protein
VRSLSFVANSKAEFGWNGRGVGSVEVHEAANAVLLFHERGTWRPEGREQDIRFSNVFRWTVCGGTIRLEHLRFGEDSPVYLFDLAPGGDREWRSVSPHLCSEDCYAAVLLIRDDGIVLRWSIDGPQKRASIEYLYSSGDDTR